MLGNIDQTEQPTENLSQEEWEEKVDPNVSKMYETFGHLFAKPIEEAAYSIIQAVANGEIDYEWFQENVGDFLNSLPICDYMGKHPEEFTPEKCQSYLREANTPQELRSSAIYQAIINDQDVQDRYKTVSRAWHTSDNGSSEEIHNALRKKLNNLNELAGETPEASLMERTRQLYRLSEETAENGWVSDVPQEKVSGWRTWISRLLS